MSQEKNTITRVKELRINEIRKENGVSFFRSEKEFSKGQVKYTLLKNEKIYKLTGVKKLMFEYKKDVVTRGLSAMESSESNK